MQAVLLYLVNLLYYTLLILIIARIIISFVNVSPYHPVVQLVYQLTEPLLGPIRNLLPAMGGLDFSPFVLIIAAQLIRVILFSLIGTS
jgi:YggT family protein